MKIKRVRSLLLIVAMVCTTTFGGNLVCAQEFNETAQADEIDGEQKNPEEAEAEDDLKDQGKIDSEAEENVGPESESADNRIDSDSTNISLPQDGQDNIAVIFENAGEDAPYDLRVNLLSVPFGVTKEKLSFSWVDASVSSMQYQTAYRIVVSKRMQDVRSGQYVYDTSWVESDDNTSVQYDLSDVLADNGLYYWQVQVKNGEGIESSLSEPQAFTTAVETGWASTSGIWGSSGEKVVMMRQQIDRPANVEKAVLSVTATSMKETSQYVYNMYVNGEEVGVGPARQNGYTLYYNTYDITDMLEEGTNVIGAINYSESGSAFLCQLTYYYSDGTQQVASNSGRDSSSWKVLNADSIYIGSDTASIGTSYYTARKDNISASAYPERWQETDYDAARWVVPTKSSGLNELALQPSQTDNMKRYEVEPKSVTQVENGKYLIDFGKEIVGSIRLSLNTSSSSVTLEYGEELNTDGSVKSILNTGNTYQEKWMLKNGSQTLSGIGMKTFRYVMVSGLRSALSAENITGLSLRQAFDDDASDFISSNEVLNDLYNMVKHTSKVTNQDVYVDTQNRERKSYEGDALITAMTSYSFSETSSAAKFSAEYLLDNTTWPAEYSLYNIMLVYENYMYTGDTRDLESSYQKLKKKTLEQYYDSAMGLMKTVTGGSISGQRIMVDWPTSEIDDYELADSYYNTVFNAVCAGAYADMAEIADALGYESDRQHYQSLSDTIRTNMIEKLYNSETGEFYDGLDSQGQIVEHAAQHATAFALAFGIYTDQAMADRMCASIEADEEIKMSVYGAYFLLQGLYQSNHGNLARKIMSNSEDILGVRSWGYMMYGLGATTTTEAWNSSLKANMSLCHPWGSAPASMLTRGMFGIQPTTAGFDTFDVKLQPGGVSSASVKIPTMKGSVEASYSLDGNGGISGTVTVPSNSEGKLYLPSESGKGTIYVDGQAQKTEAETGYLTCILFAGTHTFSSSTGIMPDDSEWLKEDAVYSTYAGTQWSEDVTNGLSSGSADGRKIEALKVKLRNQQTSGTVEYASYMQSQGWQDWVGEGEESGLASSGKRLEAVKIRLTGEIAEKYDIYYRVYVDGMGWLDWAQNGDPAGTSGYAKEVRMIQIEMVKKGEEAPGSTAVAYKSTEKTLIYSTHVQSYGWQAQTGDGETSGTVGSAKRLEAIRISVGNSLGISGGITYSTHVQSYGWQGWKSDGQIAGTTGEAKRLEAIKIKLTGDLAKEYDVYYRVHVQTFGWLDWAKNGEEAGSEGYGKRLEAIQIKLVKMGNSAPGATTNTFRKALIGYRSHVQSYGWQSYVYDGETSGTSGKAKRLEAVQIKMIDASVSGSVQYRTHIQTYGWESGWKSDGAVSGTSGKAKRLEAIQIKLTGELAKKYDIYYRVHAQSYGWLGWAKNGESAGTEGLGKRLESLEVVLVEKGGKAPGSTGNAFIKDE